MPLVVNGRERSVVGNFSGQVRLCFAEDVRPRSNMLAYLLSCLFHLQSDRVARNLNDILHLSVHAVFRSYVRRTRGSQLVLSSDLQWLESVVVSFVSASLETDSTRFFF